MAVTIRDARAGDVGAIQQIARTTWHATYGDLLARDAIDRQVDEWYADESVAENVADERTEYLVAVDGEVLGYAAGGPSNADESTTAVLHAIYVRPTHWRDGIGGQLFDRIRQRLRDREFDRLRLHVIADNDAARAFYEQYGFEGVASREVELGGSVAEEVVYEGPL